MAGPEGPPGDLTRDIPPGLPDRPVRGRPANGPKPAIESSDMPLPTHRVTICGIPELSQHCSVGVSHVLSIIDTHQPRPVVLDDFVGIDHELIRFDDVVAEYP